jgi:hypothetical protein
MIVARIAERILEQKAPATLSKVKSILQVLRDDFPELTESEKDHMMVESAPFSDEIKRRGGGYQSSWHFDDQPYLLEGGKLSDFNFNADSENIVGAINAIVDWFNKVPGYQNNVYYQKIHGNYPTGHNEADLVSIAMRLLIHYVGDAHQPLHNESVVDIEFPSGDRGGNDWKLPSHYYADNLHSVWDKVVYEWKNPKRPFV